MSIRSSPEISKVCHIWFLSCPGLKRCLPFLLSLSIFQNLLRHTRNHCRCAEFSAFCLLTFPLELSIRENMGRLHPCVSGQDVAGIVINKCKKSILHHSGTLHSSYHTHHYAPTPGVHLITCLHQLGTYFCGVFLPRTTRRMRFLLTH